MAWKIRARSPLVRSAAMVPSLGRASVDARSAGRLGTSGAPLPARGAVGGIRVASPQRRRSGRDDPVAACALGPVERPVGLGDERRAIGWSAWSGDGDADRHADRRRRRGGAGRAPRPTTGRARRPRARSPGSGCGAGPRTPRRRSGPGTSSSRTARDDRAADRAQDLVAGRVAVRVVEDLELVDVDHQHADRVARPAATREQAAELVEVASVRQAGQGVGRGLCLGGQVRVGTGQRRRGLDGRAGEQPPGRRATSRRPSGATG